MLREKAPAAEIYAVKVFDRDLATTGQALVAALAWSRRAGARLITLSLGTSNVEYEAALAREIAQAVEQELRGRCRSAGRRPSSAGRSSGVIAVDLDMALPREAGEWSIVGDRVILRASGYRPIRVPPERNLHGMSFAVANAAGARVCPRGCAGTDIHAALADVSSTSPSG